MTTPPTNNAPNALTGMMPEEIAETLQQPLMRGKQLFQWLQKKQVLQLEEMTDLPASLRASLGDPVPVSALSVAARELSERSGTMKILFALADGETIESVLLRHGDRATFCVSSQVGCALGCAFCATGLAGFRRNLSTAEIVEQALRLCHEAHLAPNESPNIVFMGMGEPFHNYDAVIRSIHILMHPLGMRVGARRITVSTVGDAAAIRRFAEEPWQVRLSVSLHAATDALRAQLTPLNKRYPLNVLHDALRYYQQRRDRQITIEYTLLEEVNDAPSQAADLAAYLRGLDAVVNIIPWNVVPELPFAPSSPARIAAFAAALQAAGVKATVRRERGGDINAACGQLRAVRTSGE